MPKHGVLGFLLVDALGFSQRNFLDMALLNDRDVIHRTFHRTPHYQVLHSALGPRPPENPVENSRHTLGLPLMSEIRSYLFCRLTPRPRIGGRVFRKNLYFYWLRYFLPKVLLVN